MAILELMKDVPDLDERMKKCYDNKHTYYHKGLFIYRDKNRLSGILGYDSEVRLKLKFVPDKRIINFDKPEDIEISSRSEKRYKVDIIDSNNKNLKKISNKLVGRIKFSEKEPLIINSVIRSDNHNLTFENYEDHDYKPTKEKAPQEIVDVLEKEIGLINKSRIPLERRREFRFGEMLKILDWIKNNMQYDDVEEEVDYLEVFKNRKGSCYHFSEIFNRMVYIAGGFSFKLSSQPTFNLPLQGHNYFSICTDPTENHVFAKVFYNGKWNFVDPIIYNSTFCNKNIPKGDEKRAFNQKIKNYHLVGIYEPRIIFLDRKDKEYINKVERMISRNRGIIIPKKYKPIDMILYPTVIKDSIEILK